jgi:Asp-tRNA(Asn)/Glu-tRNA(Gln) amidotransferase C subunit
MTDDEVRALAAAAGLDLEAERVERVRPILERALAGVERLRELPLDEPGREEQRP